MSLVEELNIESKDSVPLKGIALADDKGVPMAIVSVRLHKKLKSYAAKNRLPLATVPRQLREDINTPRSARQDTSEPICRKR